MWVTSGSQAAHTWSLMGSDFNHNMNNRSKKRGILEWMFPCLCPTYVKIMDDWTTEQNRACKVEQLNFLMGSPKMALFIHNATARLWNGQTLYDCTVWFTAIYPSIDLEPSISTRFNSAGDFPYLHVWFLSNRLTWVSRARLGLLGRGFPEVCGIKRSGGDCRCSRCWSGGRPCCVDGDTRGSRGWESKLPRLSRGFSISARRRQKGDYWSVTTF